MEVVTLLRFLRHRDDLIAKFMDGQERGRKAEPCVEEDMTRGNRRLFCFLQETEHDLGCLLLCKFSSLAATRACIRFLGGNIQTILWILGRQEYMADGQECIAVRPAERKHPKPVGKLFFCMVVKTRKKFDLLGAGTVVDGVIEDEDVDTICACQGCNGGLDDGCSEQCGEPAPMDVAGVHEAVEGILGKGEGSALEVNLHEERAMRKDRREGDEEDAEDRKATMFVGICRAQNTADVVTPEEILHFLGQLIFRVIGLC